MAVDPDLVVKDMYPLAVGDLDQRVVRGGWTYYVHAVRRPRSLGQAPFSAYGDLGAAFFGALVDGVLDWRARRNPWTVGVVRIGYIGSWRAQKPVVVHPETLAVGQEPAGLIADLVDQIRAGAFAPA